MNKFQFVITKFRAISEQAVLNGGAYSCMFIVVYITFRRLGYVHARNVDYSGIEDATDIGWL